MQQAADFLVTMKRLGACHRILSSQRWTSGTSWWSRGFPSDSVGKESTCHAGHTGDAALIPGWERSPGEGNGNQLQYSCLENLHGQRNLAGCSPWGHKELDMTKQLITHTTVVKTPSFQCRGRRCDPWLGNLRSHTLCGVARGERFIFVFFL